MSKVIHDYSSEIEEATRLILENRDSIYPYTGDYIIDITFSYWTIENDDDDSLTPIEERILYQLLNCEREKLEEYIKDTNFDFTRFEGADEREAAAINYYRNKSHKSIEELVYLVLEIENFGFYDTNGEGKNMYDFFGII